MGKKIVLCFDGTWNSPDSQTNIHKIFEALGPETEGQVPFYYTGVGAEGNALRKVIEGAVGEGITGKIRQGYDDLAGVYEPGDEIYIFGFSRGAFAARCLANMVADFGLPTRYFDSDDPATSHYTKELGDEIFNEYRHRARRDDVSQKMRDHCVAGARVEMVGVFDTVGSLGLSAAFGKVNTMRYGYLNAEWHPNIIRSYQALAIDEKRIEFAPLVWREGPGMKDPYHEMEQVWFPGVHSDVGGGYDKSDLAENALGWMIRKAMAAGLDFQRETIGQYAVQPPEELANLHESWKPFWGVPVDRTIAEGATVSGFVSLMKEMGIYSPDNLPGAGPAEVLPDGTSRRDMARVRQPGEWVPMGETSPAEAPKGSGWASVKLKR